MKVAFPSGAFFSVKEGVFYATNPGPRVLQIPTDEGSPLLLTYSRKRKFRQLCVFVLFSKYGFLSYSLYTVKSSFLGMQFYEFGQIQSYNYHYNFLSPPNVLGVF